MKKVKLNKTRQNRGNLTRKKVESAILSGKTEKQAAKAAGVSRQRVAQIKAEPEFQERINARVAAAGNVSDKEVIGTFTEQMRGVITDVLPDDGGIISQIKAAGLGHLVKKIKVRREIQPGTFKHFEIVEIEIHSSQAAAAHLAKIMGLEKLPQVNPVDEQVKVERAVEQFMKETGRSRNDAIKYLAPLMPEVNKYVN